MVKILISKIFFFCRYIFASRSNSFSDKRDYVVKIDEFKHQFWSHDFSCCWNDWLEWLMKISFKLQITLQSVRVVCSSMLQRAPIIAPAYTSTSALEWIRLLFHAQRSFSASKQVTWSKLINSKQFWSRDLFWCRIRTSNISMKKPFNALVRIF